MVNEPACQEAPSSAEFRRRLSGAKLSAVINTRLFTGGGVECSPLRCIGARVALASLLTSTGLDKVKQSTFRIFEPP